MVVGGGVMNGAKGCPAGLASLGTSAPLPIQVLGILAVGFVGLALLAALVGLAIGAVPHKLAGLGTMPERDALGLGVAAGLFGAAAGALAAWLRTPVWAQFPALAPLGSVVPPPPEAIHPVPGF